jgi:hypothetical protein
MADMAEPLIERREHCLPAPHRWLLTLAPIAEIGTAVGLASQSLGTLVVTVPLVGASLWLLLRVAWCVEIEGHSVRWRGLRGGGRVGLAQVTELRMGWRGTRWFQLRFGRRRGPWIGAYPRGSFDDWAATLEHHAHRQLRSD